MSTVSHPGPLPTAPKGGWTSALGKIAEEPDLRSVTTSHVYLEHVQYRLKSGSDAAEFAKGLESTEGKFYRQQSGCHVYVLGVSNQDPLVVLRTAIWSHPSDLDRVKAKDAVKLDRAKEPFVQMLDGPPKSIDTRMTFGIGDKPPKKEFGRERALSFDAAMGTYGRSVRPNLRSVPTSNVYLVQGEVKTKPGKAEEVAKGFDATMGRFYREQPGCHAYMFGLSKTDPDTVISVAIWSSKELFDSLPSDPKDLDMLNALRAPYMLMLDGPPEEALSMRDTTVTFGDALYSDHFQSYSRGVPAQ